MPETSETRVRARPDVIAGDICDTLKSIRKGRAAAEASIEMEKLIDAVRRTGKGGTLTMKVSVKPVHDGQIAEGRNSLQVWVDCQTNSKEPTATTQPTLCFATCTGQLSRDNPDQMRMEGLDQ